MIKNMFAAGLVLAFGISIASQNPLPAFADDAPAAAVSLDNAQAVVDVLHTLVGKEATVYLNSGEKISGKVKQVGKSAVQLTQLSSREFYDAVVRLDNISAVEMRAK